MQRRTVRKSRQGGTKHQGDRRAGQPRSANKDEKKGRSKAEGSGERAEEEHEAIVSSDDSVDNAEIIRTKALCLSESDFPPINSDTHRTRPTAACGLHLMVPKR